MSVQGQFWTREWPAAWRDIDYDVTAQNRGI